MPTALEDIVAKLERADEHIAQLKREIKTLWRETPNSTLVNYNSQSAEAFRDFHRNRAIPAKFMVIAGEIIYQLRSSIDHLTCALILRDGGTLSDKSQFPIYRFRPTKKDEIRRYEGQVKGITRSDVLTYIERSQPYHRLNDRDRHWLAILKVLSNTDKHRSLVLHVALVKPKIRVFMASDDGDITMTGESLDNGTDPPTAVSRGEKLVRIVNMERKLATDVAFAQFGECVTDYPVIKGLKELRDSARSVVADLARFLL
ncbi:MAG: hypothetical protein DMF89_16460 [Acidobacteria bacterium]|nr:MAG: hypothetical protein DMF89_16460 [Acidobacteriota bacterium]